MCYTVQKNKTAESCTFAYKMTPVTLLMASYTNVGIPGHLAGCELGVSGTTAEL